MLLFRSWELLLEMPCHALPYKLLALFPTFPTHCDLPLTQSPCTKAPARVSFACFRFGFFSHPWLASAPPALPRCAFCLLADGPSISVRRCNVNKHLDEKEAFLEEVTMLKELGKDRHSNILNIVGCCLQEEPLLLFVEQTTLGFVQIEK